MATAKLRLAAVAAAHRLGKHPDPIISPLVKATFKRLDREHGKSRKQAQGLTAEALAAVKATARIQRAHQGKLLLKESETEAVAKIGGLGEGFSGHSPRVRMAQDLSTAGRSSQSS